MCEESYESIKILSEKLMLIYDLLMTLNFDLKNVISQYFYEINCDVAPCIISLEIERLIKIYRNEYLGVIFTNFDIQELKTLIKERKLYCPRNKKRLDHINILQCDLYDKRNLWYNDTIGV
jgi:hypothetical protein